MLLAGATGLPPPASSPARSPARARMASSVDVLRTPPARRPAALSLDSAPLPHSGPLPSSAPPTPASPPMVPSTTALTTPSLPPVTPAQPREEDETEIADPSEPVEEKDAGAEDDDDGDDDDNEEEGRFGAEEEEEEEDTEDGTEPAPLPELVLAVQEFAFYAGKQGKEPDVVAPVFSCDGLPLPSFASLFSLGREARLEAFLLSAGCHGISPARLRAGRAPDVLILVAAALRLMAGALSATELHEWELDALAAQAVFMALKSPNYRGKGSPRGLRLESAALHLGALFLRTTMLPTFLNDVVLRPLSLGGAWLYYDGLQFHRRYLEAKAGARPAHLRRQPALQRAALLAGQGLCHHGHALRSPASTLFVSSAGAHAAASQPRRPSSVVGPRLLLSRAMPLLPQLHPAGLQVLPSGSASALRLSHRACHSPCSPRPL